MKMRIKPIIAYDQQGQAYIDSPNKFDQTFYHRANVMNGFPISISCAYLLICDRIHELMDNEDFKSAAALLQGDWISYLSKEGYRVVFRDNEWEFIIDE